MEDINWGDAVKSGVSGAGTGFAIGGPWGAAGGALLAAGGSIASSLLSRNKNKETPIQKKQRELVDQMLASLNGTGPYSNLFSPSDQDFQRSIVDPAKSRFRNQIAPQIQQSFIANGQQRGTGLEDSLTRAGVDLDQLINQSYLQYQQGYQNRQSNAMNAILGLGKGAENAQSFGEAAGQGLAGYLSQGAGKDISGILREYENKKYEDPYNTPLSDPRHFGGMDDTVVIPPSRKGFENTPWSLR